MNSWEFLFEEKILNRGCFITDDVRILSRSSRKVNAIVSGTFDYDVEIEFDDDGYVDSMSCTCPYFERDNCKHLAALLYYLEECEDDEIEDDDIDELFNSVDDEKLNEFLLEELHGNWELRNRFRLKFSQKIDKNHYKSKFDDIIYEDDFSYGLSRFIHNDVEFLFDKKEYDLILEMMDDAFFNVCSQLEYPWNDKYYDNLDEISEVISGLANTSISEDVFDWLKSVFKNRADEDYIIRFFEILIDNFSLKSQLEEKYDLLTDIIPKTSSFYKESFILAKIRLMGELGYPQSEIDEFRLKYLKYPQVRQQFIDETIEVNDYSKAMELLKRGISSSKHANDKYNFHIQLKELYLKSDDLENYKKALFRLIIEYNDINDYKELKKQYSKDDWIDVREEIFLNCSDCNSFLNECYAYDRLYGSLIDNIRHESDLSYYKKRLSKDYSWDLLEKYSSIVNQKASRTGTRKHYKNIANLLNEMLSIPGGDAVVSGILSEWKVKYKNRPAMWDELQKVRI